MKQWLRSVMLLSIPVIAWGCKSDPTVPNTIGVAAKLVATPSTVFVAQGTPEAISVTLVDANGNPVPGTFTLTPPADAAITVTQDTSVGLVYDALGNLVQKSSVSSARYLISASGFAASSFQVSAGGFSVTIPVSSFPTNLPATFSSTAPALGQSVTITAPAGLTFSPTVRLTKSLTDTASVGIVTGRTATTITYLPFFGQTSTFAVRGVIPAYAPSLILNLVTTTPVVVGGAATLTKIAGTNAIATAPTITLPALGVTQAFFDKPPFGYAGCAAIAALGDNCNVFKITVAATTKFHLTLDWDNTSDLGVYFLNSTGTALAAGVGNADAGGTGASGHPEAADITLTAGTYYMAVLRFTYAGSTVDPSYYFVTLTGL